MQMHRNDYNLIRTFLRPPLRLDKMLHVRRLAGRTFRIESPLSEVQGVRGIGPPVVRLGGARQPAQPGAISRDDGPQAGPDFLASRMKRLLRERGMLPADPAHLVDRGGAGTVNASDRSEDASGAELDAFAAGWLEAQMERLLRARGITPVSRSGI